MRILSVRTVPASPFLDPVRAQPISGSILARLQCRQPFFGNLGRNTVYGKGMQTLDLALHRELNIAEAAKAQIRSQPFKAFIHINLGRQTAS